MTNSEKQRELTELPAGEAHHEFDEDIHRSLLYKLVEAQSYATPDAIAVVYEEECLTYAAIERASEMLALNLRVAGIGPEKRVAIGLERGLALVVGILAVLKAGGAYVPLDMSYPFQRLEYILLDAQVAAILTQNALVHLLPPTALPTLLLDGLPLSSPNDQAVLNTQIQPENIAYVIYTSGSTGRPKGVEVSHQAICNTLCDYTQKLGFQPGMRILQFAALGFDATVLDIFSPLIVGACLILACRAQLEPGPPLIDTLRRSAITSTLIPPSTLTVLPQADLPDLRLLLSGGEAISTRVIAKWAPGRCLYNIYGPTENAVCTTMALCPEHEVSPSIGRPLANMQVYILDDSFREVQQGDIGGIYIGGVGLARGYLGKPDLTAERFIPDPFVGTSHDESGRYGGASEPGARLYRTGDLGRYRADGLLEFVGREDQQIKLRGFRVEPGEIEAVLSQHPLLHEAVVVAREDIPGAMRLVAYFTISQPDTQPSVYDLSAYLKARLPDYMVPTVFIPLKYLPLTPHGKLDRRALPAPTREERYVAPRTQREIVLAQLWEQLFCQSRIGTDENFFELGGHSLLITQMLARIREAFGITLPMASIFENPTIAALAERLEAQQVEGSSWGNLALGPVSREIPLPLSFPQEQVWFLLQLDPQNLSYNTQARFELNGKLDIAALERSLNEIVRRHEIFRTTFVERESRPFQIIHAFSPFRLPVMDLQTLPIQERVVEAERLMRAEFRRPFVITQLPLMRWTLLRLDTSTAWLLHVEHHFVHDGWSFTVFVRELLALYQAFSVHQPSPLAELPIQFADFVYRQRQWMQGEILESQLAYWKKRLAGSPPLLKLPTDRPRLPVQSSNGAALRVHLAPSLYAELKALGQREGATLFMTMLAALFILLYRYTGQEDICVGSGVANRRWKESEALIGMLVNTIVLRSDLSGNPSFQAFLRQVRATTLEAYKHQDMPFGTLVDALQPERNLSYNPLFQVIFGFHDSPLPDLELPELTFKLHEGLNNGSAKFDLGIVVIPHGEQHPGKARESGITLIWEYNTDLFTQATMQQMASCYEHLLGEIVRHPDQGIANLSLLTMHQQQQLLATWNKTELLETSQLCLHQRFERQAALTSDACALWMNGCGLTYQELNERANQLAWRLRRLGVGPDRPVALFLPYSLEMVVGQLGVLKAGGAYVPLDPSHPQERIAFLLEDIQARIVLTIRTLLAELPQQPELTISLAEEWVETSEDRTPDPPWHVSPEHLAYVIYTSGSTGQPKGAAIPHKGVCNLVDALAMRCGIEPTERVLQFASLSFDVTVLEIFTTLTHGACLVLARKEQLLPGSPLLDTLRMEAITWAFLPPSTLGILPRVELPNLHTLLSGGEACSARLIANWAPGRNFYNVYGPTEAAVCATLAHCIPGEITPSLGHPLPNTQIYILDTHLRPVPTGVAGELFIGGIGLARGYLRRPDLTAERFVPHPFVGTSHDEAGGSDASDASDASEPGTRLYRTGDLVRYHTDGTLEFLGRIDYQVKIRGFRIEPGEIEATLLTLPEVQDAVVIAQEDRSGEKRLVAYIVLQPTVSPDIRKLRQKLKDLLPGYMIPATLIFLDALPLSPNGKVDRRALPTPQMAPRDRSARYIAPQNDLERTISVIWQEELQIEHVSRDDNFFDLGGHSLAMVRVYQQMRSQLKQIFSLVDLFKYPTIDSLAQYLSQGEQDFSLQESLARATAHKMRTQRQRQFWRQHRMMPEERGDEYEC